MAKTVLLRLNTDSGSADACSALAQDSKRFEAREHTPLAFVVLLCDGETVFEAKDIKVGLFANNPSIEAAT